jgi:hypothetical protein
MAISYGHFKNQSGDDKFDSCLILSLFLLGRWGEWCFDIGTIQSCKIYYKDASGSFEPRSW